MTSAVAHILEEVKMLSMEEKHDLFRDMAHLIGSSYTSTVEKEWVAVAEERLSEYRSGENTMRPIEEVMTALEKKYH